MNTPILEITDGTMENTVNMLSLLGWSLRDWKPAVPEAKGGGTFRDSPIMDGRKLVYRRFTNIIDTFNLVGNAGSQNEMITTIQKLQKLLEKAISYWTSGWQSSPVWIKAKAAQETNPRYAVIIDYRLSGFGGPFEQPFFASSCVSATEALLIIEHMFWQETEPGEDGECAECSSSTYSADVGTLNDGTFYPAQSSDDGTFSKLTTKTGPVGADLTSEYMTVGHGSGVIEPGSNSIGILFNNVTVPNCAHIIKATLTLTCYEPGVGDATLIVYGQDPSDGDATTFSTVDDFFGRKRTSSFHITLEADTVCPGPIDVTRIVQEIVGNPVGAGTPGNPYVCPNYWASGDDMVFMVDLYSGTGGRVFCTFDHGDANEYPALYIQYSVEGVNLGRGATCEQEVFVANKQNRAIITDAYWYDDSLTSWSANLIEASLPIDILPASPAVGDRLYIGSDTSLVDGGPFNNAIFDIGTVQGGITGGTWKYWNGASWHAFVVADSIYRELDGDAILFANEGVTSIVFQQMSDWATCAVNGVTGYWICFEITSVSGGTTAPEQANRAIYTTINPYIEIDGNQVPGDVPALARVLFDSAAFWQRSMNTLVMGLRSLSRGEDFAAYLNASDKQNPPGIAFEVCTQYTGLSSSDIVDFIRAPTGRALCLNNYLPITYARTYPWPVCSWTLSADLAKQYLGSFHAFVRYMTSDSDLVGAQFRLRSVFGEEFNASYSDIGTVVISSPSASRPYALDLGQFNILPSPSVRPNDVVDVVKIYLEVWSDADADFDASTHVIDIILIPADEWAGNFGMPKATGTAVLYYGKGLDIDAITNPRQYRAIETTIESSVIIGSVPTRSLAAEWSRIASSEPIFQQKADQKIWFLQFHHQEGMVSYFENCGKVCAQRSARYLLARGSG